jgi:hypothetical protein
VFRSGRLAPTKRVGHWQYQIFLPKTVVTAFAETRRPQAPVGGTLIEEARVQLRARGLHISRPWFIRLCCALGVEKASIRTGVGRGKGRRLTYLLTARDVAQIDDALWRWDSLCEAARQLRWAKGTTTKSGRARA